MGKAREKHIIKAGSWVLIGHLLSQLIRLGGNLLLTRLLVPEMFGVMAIVQVMLMGVQMLSDLGLGQSIIQSKKGEEVGFINTAWTIQVIRGWLLWLIICLLAALLWAANASGYISSNLVYGNPLLPWLMVTVGISAVISGFNSTAIYQVNRNLMLGRLTVINLTAQIIALLFILVIAWQYETIWALAIGSLVASFIDMLGSHKILPGIKNKLHWDKTAIKELLHFGKWIFLSSAIGFIASQGDRLVLGGLLTAEMLGIYSIAFMLSSLPSTIVSQLSHKILFPNFSRINREHPEQLKASLIKSKRWLGLLVLPLTGILISWGQLIIDFLYDDRYIDAGWMMSLLLLRVATGCISTPNSLLMMAKGLPQYSTISAALKAVFVFTVLPFVYTSYGLNTAVLIIGLSGLIDIPVLWWALLKYRIFSIKSEILSVLLLAVGYGIGLFFFQFT